MAGPSSYHPHTHQHLHFHQHLARGGIGQPLLVEPLVYPTQSVVQEGIGYLVDVVFIKDPLNFFCQLVVGRLPHLYALMGKLATVYSGKEL